ncbi:MAG: redoxin family protein, partial [Gemmatimonadaceae bacterium]
AGSAKKEASVAIAVLMGAATGLVWAPCAGPILALVLAGAAVGDLPRSSLVFVLLSFAAGSGVVFAMILTLGDIMRKRFQSTWLRVHRGVEFTIGAAALAAAILLFTGTDAQLFARVPTAPTAGIERALVRGLAPGGIHGATSGVLPDLGELPSLEGGIGWLNSAPITRESLKGKVTMVEIWTFACYNCLNALPHVKETAARYKAQGLVTIGVHTPELPRERVRENVERAVKDLGVVFPVVLDNNYIIWKAFNNEYWPSVYVIDKKGRIRFHHDGEGSYKELDAAVATLLAEKP